MEEKYSKGISVEWQRYLADFEQSGLSGMEYCRRHNLVYSRFSYWRIKLNRPRTSTPEIRSAFTKVVTVNNDDSGSGLTLSLPNGVRIGGIHDGNLALVSKLLTQL